MEEFVMGDHARLVASMRLAMELAASSRLFAKLFDLFASDALARNLVTLNWSVEQLGKIVFLGHSFSAMVKMLELSMSKQEKFGVSEQREKVRRVLAVQDYVYEIELCAGIDGLLDSPLWEDDNSDSEECVCMYCIARRERCDMISALPNTFSVHLFHLDPEIDMEHLVPGNSTTVWSTVNVQMNYDAQLAGSSSPYTKFIGQLKENPSIGDCISSMLGAHECMELVIYGIGSFEFDVKSQYQLAFALLLKEDEVFPIGDIEIYDPALSLADVKACLDLGPTIFHVPGLKLGGNLLESNFSPKQKMILVSYRFKDSGKLISSAIENWNCGSTSIRDSLTLERDRFVLIGVSELKLEFLETDDDMDIHSKLPSIHVASLRVQLEERISRPFKDQSGYEDDDPPFWGSVFRHRLPAKNRTTWSPPPEGWIKLNFHGIGCSKRHVLSYYAGPVGDVDQIVASAMALQVGLQNMIELHEPVYKLNIEGDDLKVIRCCNGISSPPKRAHDSFSYIYPNMYLRPTKKLSPDKLPEECNNGKDDNDDSKDDDKNDRPMDRRG
ncbi:hypothetical protein SETIT_7G216800v2 [Setaria italica]|uniref:SRR1-like domain-containing protein n=1 Tax=Setaria italica TaxID=4555 RepID=K3YCN3_SETIT|nr:hypothetical protein SETIT_7G216800v2 [Setaria italica]